MLLSALKILIFFAIVLAITLGAIQLSESGQGLSMVYGGTEYTLGPVQLFIAVLVVVLLGWLVVKLLGLLLAFVRFLLGDETAINRYFARSRQRKGYEALSEGMLAVASGEGGWRRTRPPRLRNGWTSRMSPICWPRRPPRSPATMPGRARSIAACCRTSAPGLSVCVD